MKPVAVLIGIIAFLLLAIAGLTFLLLRVQATATKTVETEQSTVNQESDQRAATVKDADSFLSPHQEKLQATSRPVVDISLEAMGNDDVLVSKVGGAAYWPEGQTYPKGSNGKALFLLAQIRFDQMPAAQGYPEKGMLQFFIADTDFYGANFDGDYSIKALQEQKDFRVVYWPNTQAKSQVLAVSASELLPHDPKKPRRMRFQLKQEVMSMSDFRFDTVLGGDYYAMVEAYAKAKKLDEDSLTDLIWERSSGSGHKMGGYPFFTQEDPRDKEGMELLFQLDSDDDMMWGDVGVANFFINPDDLKNLNFNRVAYSWDCH